MGIKSHQFFMGLMALGLLGCQTGQPMNPNDPNQVGDLQPEVLRHNVKIASDGLLERVGKEISDAQYKDLLADYTKQALESTSFEQLNPHKAWIIGDLYRTARLWDKAEATLKIAVKNAQTDDRRVNDSLRLAQVEAMNGHVAQGIQLANQVIDSKPKDPGPVLPSVLLELTPAAKGKGSDVALAQVLERAIDVHLTMKVDTNTDSGRSFLVARPFHIRKAWSEITKLYLSAGRTDLAQKSAKRAMAMETSTPPPTISNIGGDQHVRA